MKKIYKLTQNVRAGFDTFDSCIVCATSGSKARLIHPKKTWDSIDNDKDLWNEIDFPTWADTPDQVIVEYLGKAGARIKEGSVICASFNAS